MLALVRGEGQSIIIDGNIEVKIVKWSRSSVRLAIQAPRSVSVDRDEIWRKMHPGQASPLEKAEQERRERFEREGGSGGHGPGNPPRVSPPIAPPPFPHLPPSSPPPAAPKPLSPPVAGAENPGTPGNQPPVPRASGQAGSEADSQADSARPEEDETAP